MNFVDVRGRILLSIQSKQTVAIQYSQKEIQELFQLEAPVIFSDTSYSCLCLKKTYTYYIYNMYYKMRRRFLGT